MVRARVPCSVARTRWSPTGMKWRRQTYSHEKVAIKRHKRLKTDLESGPDFFFFLSLLCLFMAMNELHRYARSIFDHALSAVDPRQAVKNIELDLPSPPIYLIATRQTPSPT